jgi:hypothetical protein
MAAAMLSQPSATFGRLHFICGFSPDMIRCCWYYTSVHTLMRYFGNLVRYIAYHPESDIGRLQASEQGSGLGWRR